MSDAHKSEAAVVVTEPGQNIALVTKEILKSLGVKKVYVHGQSPEVVQLISRGSVGLVVVDDSPYRPASILLRQLLRTALAPITKTIVLLSEHNKQDAKVLSTLGRPMIINKPLTPGRFSPAYRSITDVWSKGIFAEITKARDLIAQEYFEPGMIILTELLRDKKAQPIIAPTISVLLRQSSNLQVAEKILLAALKSSPRDVGLILSLSDLYMHAAMPFTAIRLMKGMDAVYDATWASCMDKLQAYQMIGDLASSTALLKDMLSRPLFEEETREHLVRLLYSQGDMEEFMSKIKSDAKAQRFRNLWGKTLNPSPAVRAS